MKKDVKLISIILLIIGVMYLNVQFWIIFFPEAIAEVSLIIAMIGTLVWTSLSLIFIGKFLTCYFLTRDSMKD